MRNTDIYVEQPCMNNVFFYGFSIDGKVSILDQWLEIQFLYFTLFKLHIPVAMQRKNIVRGLVRLGD